MLQRERERSLTAGHDFRSDSDAAAGVLQTVSEIRTLVESLQAVNSAEADMQLRRAVAAKCDELVGGVNELVQAVSTSARQAPRSPELNLTPLDSAREEILTPLD